MIRAGKLREHIRLESRLETVLASGAVEVQWVAEGNLRAELVQETADAFLGSVERTDDRKVFRTWAVEWITTDMRLVHAGQTYRITRIVRLDRLGLELHCVNSDEVAA